jgi:hypothetical protein
VSFSGLVEIIAETRPTMLILMAIDAEVFPVRAVGWVIVRIAVLVMHRQQLSVAMGKLPPALGAHHPMDFKGALPVVAD